MAEQSLVSDDLMVDNKNNHVPTATPPLLWSSRLMLAVMGCMGTFNVYSLRVSISAAIVAMVNYTAVEEKNTNDLRNHMGYENISVVLTCPNLLKNVSTNLPTHNDAIQDGEFVWGAADQGRVLASYFYGYVITQIPGAWFGRRFGRVRVWGCCMLLASFTTLMSPIAASRGGVPGIVAVRILVGFCSGVSYPLMHGMWGNWSPPTERSFLTSIHFAGGSLGSVVIFPLTAFLSNTFGWQSVFYVTGAFGILWSIAWLALMYDSPATHPRITNTEKNYIQASLISSDDKVAGAKHNKSTVPWLKMFSSPAFLCVAFAQFASNFGGYIVLTMLPTYLYTILHFSVKESGVLSAIPYILKLLLLLVSGRIVDMIIAKGVKTIYIRKIVGVLSLAIPGLGIVVVSFLDCNVAATIAFFTLVVGLDAFTVPGFKACLIDIAPELCGVMFSVGNTLSSAAGFTAPLIVSAFREANKQDIIKGWRGAFGLGAAVYCLGAVGFLLFGSSELQPWAKVDDNDMERNDKKRETTNT